MPLHKHTFHITCMKGNKKSQKGKSSSKTSNELKREKSISMQIKWLQYLFIWKKKYTFFLPYVDHRQMQRGGRRRGKNKRKTRSQISSYECAPRNIPWSNAAFLSATKKKILATLKSTLFICRLNLGGFLNKN